MSKAKQEHKAMILKGLAHPIRLSIVELLAEKELCVKEIADLYPYDRTTISKHLAQLKKLNILEGVRDGLNIYYHLKMPAISQLLHLLDDGSAGNQPSSAQDDQLLTTDWQVPQRNQVDKPLVTTPR